MQTLYYFFVFLGQELLRIVRYHGDLVIHHDNLIPYRNLAVFYNFGGIFSSISETV
jgi:hypothetical protein